MAKGLLGGRRGGLGLGLMLLLSACENTEAVAPGNLSIPGAELAASAGASPGTQPGGSSGGSGGQADPTAPYVEPTLPPLGPAPGAPVPSPKAEAPLTPTPRPTRPAPAPTPAPVEVVALPSLASLPSGPAAVEGSYPLPAGAKGTLTLSQPGYVPLTYEMPQPAPAALHLSPVNPGRQGGGLWRLSGQLQPASAGVLFTLVRQGQAPVALGRSDAQGRFSFNASSEGRAEAILVAQSSETLPSIALRRLSLGAEGGDQANLTMAMQKPVSAYRLQAYLDQGPGPFPDPPVGLDLAGGVIVAAEKGPPAWRADLFSLAPGILATYRLGDFALGRLERARNPEGTEWSEVAASLESGFPPFLYPPLLTEVARPVPGGRVAWPPVEGAANYRVRLLRDDGSEALLWEAAVLRASAPVPADAPPFEGPLRLEIEALQASGATAFNLAQVGPRALRLGEGLPGASGRRSWSIKRFP